MRSHTPKVLLAVLFLAAFAPPAHAAVRELHKAWRFPAADGKKVVVDAQDTDVMVRAADVKEVMITAELKISGVTTGQADRWITTHTPRFQDGVEALEVTIPAGRHGFLGLGMVTARAKIGVILPITMIPDLTTRKGSIKIRGDFPTADPLHLRTAEGPVEMTGAAGSVDLRTVSGDARITVVRPLDAFFARTASGDIVLTGGAKKVHVDSASGDIWLNNLSGPVNVVSAKGKVTLRWDRLDPGTAVRVRNTSGEIHLILPAGVRPAGELRTVKGKILTDFPATISPDGLTVSFGGDGPSLDVETASGRIEVTRAGDGDGWKIKPPPIERER